MQTILDGWREIAGQQAILGTNSREQRRQWLLLDEQMELLARTYTLAPVPASVDMPVACGGAPDTLTRLSEGYYRVRPDGTVTKLPDVPDAPQPVAAPAVVAEEPPAMPARPWWEWLYFWRW